MESSSSPPPSDEWQLLQESLSILDEETRANVLRELEAQGHTPAKTTHYYPIADPFEDRPLEKRPGPPSPTVAERFSIEQEYSIHIEGIPGYDNWSDGEKDLHRIVFMRGHKPLLPRSWAWDFKGVPLPPTIYAPSADTEVPIYARSDKQFKATKALQRLMDLHARVRGLQQRRQRGRISGTIAAEINKYLTWAFEEIGLEKVNLISNILIFQINVEGNEQDRTTLDIEQQIQSEFDFRYEQFVQHFESLRDRLPPGMESQDLKPPLIYGFAIIQHLVMIITRDGSVPDAQLNVVTELDMSMDYQGLWQGLTLAIPIQLARDTMDRMRLLFPLKPADPPLTADDMDIDA